LWSGIDPYTVIPEVPPTLRWKGDPVDLPCDYDRACEADGGWASLIPFTTENVLVLSRVLYWRLGERRTPLPSLPRKGCGLERR